MHLRLVSSLLLVLTATTLWAAGDAVVRKSSDLTAMQDQLNQLRRDTDSRNEMTGELNKLWSRAKRIAEMNSKCGTISINDVMDESCSNFFAVELPEFEDDFMRITGEIKLGNMSKSVNDAQNMAQNINACSDALNQFFLSPEQLSALKMNEELEIEQLDRYGSQFEIAYDFTIAYNKKKLRTIKKLAELWINSCADYVVKKNNSQLAPLFLNNLQTMIDETSADVEVSISNNTIYFSGGKNTAAYYNLGNSELFNTVNEDMGNYLILNLNSRSLTASYSITPHRHKGKVVVNTNGFDGLEGRLEWRSSGLSRSRSHRRPVEEDDEDEEY